MVVPVETTIDGSEGAVVLEVVGTDFVGTQGTVGIAVEGIQDTVEEAGILESEIYIQINFKV